MRIVIQIQFTGSPRERAQCIIDQYSGYKVDQVDKFLDGRITQGENIADNGGIKQAYRVSLMSCRSNKVNIRCQSQPVFGILLFRIVWNSAEERVMDRPINKIRRKRHKIRTYQYGIVFFKQQFLPIATVLLRSAREYLDCAMHAGVSTRDKHSE